MGVKGRTFAVGVVGLFNILRYFYYHRYLGLPFEANFFILTGFFLLVAWWCGKQFDRAKYYSEKDPLTDTYNRRTIEQTFEKLAETCKRKDEQLGVIVIDLDNFKEVNDKFGHQKGDELLQHVSSVLKSIAKEKDFIARWGGDEFVILVSNIKDGFESNYVQLLQDKLTKTDLLPNFLFTASIGVAIYPVQGVKIGDLIQIADLGMYEMKGKKHKEDSNTKENKGGSESHYC